MAQPKAKGKILSLLASVLFLASSALAQNTGSIKLGWDYNNLESSFAGFRMYYDTQSRGAVQNPANHDAPPFIEVPGNVNSFETSVVVPSLDCNTEYFFSVTAYDGVNVPESDYSNEISAKPRCLPAPQNLRILE